jgi:hypothetical protein
MTIYLLKTILTLIFITLFIGINNEKQMQINHSTPKEPYVNDQQVPSQKAIIKKNKSKIKNSKKSLNHKIPKNVNIYLFLSIC